MSNQSEQLSHNEMASEKVGQEWKKHNLFYHTNSELFKLNEANILCDCITLFTFLNKSDCKNALTNFIAIYLLSDFPKRKCTGENFSLVQKW